MFVNCIVRSMVSELDVPITITSDYTVTDDVFVLVKVHGEQGHQVVGAVEAAASVTELTGSGQSLGHELGAVAPVSCHPLSLADMKVSCSVRRLTLSLNFSHPIECSVFYLIWNREPP